ncbi:Synembryn-like protein [Escovopsis weberi]|uniref:Synembryn-like protein n=1 Tax=Escovopsis weberi TaxID=150374 RepID=A0A0M8N1R9_ESCWE|nr:Synembryn-like protein [Escovopsis weberi]
MASSAMGTAKGPAKLKAVTELVDKLARDLEDATLSLKAREDALEELKIYGRDPAHADPIFTTEGISMLLRYGFDGPACDTARAAQRVLANAMLLRPETRQIFVDKACAAKACSELETDNWDTEFLVSRVLFLSTYGTSINLEDLITNHRLADRIVDNLGRHAKLVTTDEGKSPMSQPMEDMALAETLKLLFNVTHFCKEQTGRFAGAVPHIVALLWKQDVPPPRPLEAPFGPLINALLNMDLSIEATRDAVFPPKEPARVSERLIEILDAAMRTYPESDLETVVTPLVSLLGKIHEHAPAPAKQRIRALLLPADNDRTSVLGRGDGLSAILLKNSTNPIAPALRDAISHLLFDMSDKDASTFVQNVGYGFASGFLFQNNVPVPASASEAFGAGDVPGGQRLVNPITGQFLDSEKALDETPMSEEEREREAERLFHQGSMAQHHSAFDL